MSPDRRPAAARHHDEIAVDERLPPFTVELTLQRLVMEAAANRDFSPWHFDPEAAAAVGPPAVFANTTLVETLLEAAIRSWAGVAARIEVLEYRMVGFTCAGDRIVGAGVVTATEPGGVVELDVWLESGRERTVEGRARLAFPIG